MVDLDGFEPSTSSMPFKKYQSLTGVSTRNKRLSTRRFGRHGATLGRLDSARTPGLHVRRPACVVLSRGCRRFRLLSGGYNISFLYKDDAQVERSGRTPGRQQGTGAVALTRTPHPGTIGTSTVWGLRGQVDGLRIARRRGHCGGALPLRPSENQSKRQIPSGSKMRFFTC